MNLIEFLDHSLMRAELRHLLASEGDDPWPYIDQLVMDNYVWAAPGGAGECDGLTLTFYANWGDMVLGREAFQMTWDELLRTFDAVDPVVQKRYAAMEHMLSERLRYAADEDQRQALYQVLRIERERFLTIVVRLFCEDQDSAVS